MTDVRTAGRTNMGKNGDTRTNGKLLSELKKVKGFSPNKNAACKCSLRCAKCAKTKMLQNTVLKECSQNVKNAANPENFSKNAALNGLESI